MISFESVAVVLDPLSCENNLSPLCANNFVFHFFISSLPWSLQCVSSGESSRAAPSVNFFFKKGFQEIRLKMDTCKLVDLFFLLANR